MDTIHFYVIQTGLFLETFNGPTEQFCIHGQLSLGGNVSLIRSSIKGACVWGGGYLLVFHDFTSIFSFTNINEYANEIILYMTIG